MSLSHLNQEIKHCRNFDCWRGLEEGERYDCTISALAGNRVGVRLDIIEFCVSTEAAVEIADCLRDAFSIVLYDHENPYGERDLSARHIFKKTCNSAQKFYRAEGQIEVLDGSPELFSDDEASGSVGIVIQTIPGGGYEIVFDFMSYSFAIQDAIWMSNSLMQVWVSQERC